MCMSADQKRQQEGARKEAHENSYCVDATGNLEHKMNEYEEVMRARK